MEITPTLVFTLVSYMNARMRLTEIQIAGVSLGTNTIAMIYEYDGSCG